MAAMFGWISEQVVPSGEVPGGFCGFHSSLKQRAPILLSGARIHAIERKKICVRLYGRQHRGTLGAEARRAGEGSRPRLEESYNGQADEGRLPVLTQQSPAAAGISNDPAAGASKNVATNTV